MCALAVLAVGLGLKAASERVRVARCLRQLPVIRRAFGAGEVSYSQVRALTRICTADNEQRHLAVARRATGEQLDRLVRGMRRGMAARDRDAARRAGTTCQPTAPTVRTRYDGHGNLILTLRCTAEDGAVLLAALDAARSDLDHPTDPSPAEDVPPAAAESSAEDSPIRASLADALFALAHLHVRGRHPPARARRDRAQLTVHIDPLTGWTRLPDGEFLPPGTPGLDLPAGPLRPFTDLDRLCSRHHAVVHAGRFQLRLDPASRALTVTTADGHPVLHRPPLPAGDAAALDHNQQIQPGTLPPYAIDTLDLPYAVGVLMQWAA